MLKNLLKNVVYGVFGTFLALNAGCSRPITTEDYLIDIDNFKAKPYVKLYTELKVSKPVKEVSNVPESFRNVPIHSDDRGSGGVIGDDSAKLPPLIDYSFLKGGLETKVGDNRLDIYADLAFNFSYFLPDSHDPTFGEVNERNYMGAPGTDKRGYGTALTYWSANYAPILIPGLKCDLSLPVDEEHDIIIGGGVREYELQAERGWDRYNALDKKDHLRIADVTEKVIYLGFRSHDREDGMSTTFKIGYNFYDFDVEEKEVVIDKKDKSFFVALSGEFLF